MVLFGISAFNFNLPTHSVFPVCAFRRVSKNERL